MLRPIHLDGFDPKYGTTSYSWGDPVEYDGRPWQNNAYSMEVLAWFYHDYMGVHAYAQVWDYAEQMNPEQRWQFVLLVNYPTYTMQDGAIIKTYWSWRIQERYDVERWGPRPSFSRVGADVEAWIGEQTA